MERFLPGARVVAFGHMGDGNIHFNVSQPVGADKAAFLSAMGGDERGRPRDRRPLFRLVLRRARHRAIEARRARARKNPVALDVMRKIKAALDPDGILNPGKVL